MTNQSFKTTAEGAVFTHKGRRLQKVKMRGRTKGTGGRINAVDVDNGDEFFLEAFETVVCLGLDVLDDDVVNVDVPVTDDRFNPPPVSDMVDHYPSDGGCDSDGFDCGCD